jgi:hypothetical protein
LGRCSNEPDEIPPGVRVRFTDRLRKRLERQRDREAALARQIEADRELRDRLIAATGGNIIRSSALDDVAPIKLALELVPIDRIVSAIRSKTNKKLFPGNEPATSWREERLLREIADSYFRSIIQPRLVAAWAAAGKTPAPTAQNSPPPAAPMADIDELRRRHDSPSATAGPHSLSPPDAAPSAPDMAQKPADASEPLPAVSSHPRTGKSIHGPTGAA